MSTRASFSAIGGSAGLALALFGTPAAICFAPSNIPRIGSTRHFGLEAAQTPEIYIPHTQSPSAFMILVVRGQGSGADLLNACRREIAAMDPQQAIMDGGSLASLVSGAQARRRFQSALLTTFAGVAVLLAALGIYGVTTHAVTRRAREIGTRIALGARPRDVVLMIAKTGSRTILIGALIGVTGALALSKVLANLLFGVSPLDATTFVAVALLLGLVAGSVVVSPKPPGGFGGSGDCAARRLIARCAAVSRAATNLAFS